jgi:hypothetical protein
VGKAGANFPGLERPSSNYQSRLDLRFNVLNAYPKLRSIERIGHSDNDMRDAPLKSGRLVRLIDSTYPACGTVPYINPGIFHFTFA